MQSYAKVICKLQVCRRCSVAKHASDYGMRLSKKQVICKSCLNIAQKKKYHSSEEMREYRYQKGIERRKANYFRYNKLKETTACTDCGKYYLPCVMDYDHVDPSTKTKCVGQMVGKEAWPRVLAEINKCELVCANCHRIRTHVKKNT